MCRPLLLCLINRIQAKITNCCFILCYSTDLISVRNESCFWTSGSSEQCARAVMISTDTWTRVTCHTAQWSNSFTKRVQ